jgi:hypothetical protein
MKTFLITLTATATRALENGAITSETIISQFTAEGTDALAASNGAVEEFKSRYTADSMPDRNLVGCADLDDFEITAITVHEDEEGML